jgi:predicted nucleotide-binding protein
MSEHQQDSAPNKTSKENPAETTLAIPAKEPPKPGTDKPEPSAATDTPSMINRDVFFICDEKAKATQSCLLYIKELGLNPIFVYDSKNINQTLEQTCSTYPHICFAIVILSADDFSYPKEKKPGEAKLRTRQNFVFALGFLSSKYGRQNVFVLYQEQKNFLLPTPYHHAIYTALDTKEIWKKELATRLKSRGYQIP